MQHEKIIKRADGSKVKISISVGISMMKVYWNAGCFICPVGKRKFDYNHTDGAATNEEIQEAKLELWQMIKP